MVLIYRIVIRRPACPVGWSDLPVFLFTVPLTTYLGAVARGCVPEAPPYAVAVAAQAGHEHLAFSARTGAPPSLRVAEFRTPSLPESMGARPAPCVT